MCHAQKLEAVCRLTGGVAHDFNNLLRVIGGNLQLLQRDLDVDERSAARLLAAERGARLASQLLAFARRQPLEPVVLNLGGVLQEMDELMQSRPQRHERRRPTASGACAICWWKTENRSAPRLRNC